MNQRLVKLALPSDLVSDMDDYINGTSSYSGRQDFVADAIANLLADLEVTSSEQGAESPRSDTIDVGPLGDQQGSNAGVTGRGQRSHERVRREDSEVELYPIEPMSSAAALALTGIAFPTDGVLLTAPRSVVPLEPTWGIHNRDYPTLWAAGLLSVELEEKETVSYHSWLADTTRIAWRIADALRTSDLDLSGFPMNRAKAEKSEARFVRFFLGDDAGQGPLFDLGLAAVTEDDQVALTSAGSDLLSRIKDWSPRLDAHPGDRIASAFLDHLAAWVPADFDFLHKIIVLIDSGISERNLLVSTISEAYNDWPGQVAGTNVAGFVGRARQWGLIERRQERRQYLLAPGARALIEEANEIRWEE